MLYTLGLGAPPVSRIRLTNDVASAELTAPLVGFGVFSSASSDPAQNQGRLGLPSAGCVRHSYPQFMPALVEQESGALSDLLTAIQGVTALPEASPLWQAPFFLAKNWLLDTSVYARALTWRVGSHLPHMAERSPLCENSFVATGQQLPGTRVALDPHSVPTFPDPLWPEYEQTAGWLEALSGNRSEFRRLCGEMDGDVPDGRHDISRHCRFGLAVGFGEARTSSTDAAGAAGRSYQSGSAVDRSNQSIRHNRTTDAYGWNAIDGSGGNRSALADGNRDNRSGSGHIEPSAPLYFSATPRLIVRNASGAPLAGKYCTIREEGSTWADMLKLRVGFSSCGPSDENGEMQLEGLHVFGGATRELKLVVQVEGVPAALSSLSFWRDDSRLQ